VNYSDLTVVIPTKDNEDRVSVLVGTIPLGINILIVESDNMRHHKKCVDRATVMHFIWDKTYPKKRNWVLEEKFIKTKWVLFLDDDEMVTSKGYAEILNKINQNKHDAFWLKYDLFFSGSRLRFGVAQRKLALFKAELFLYEKVKIGLDEKFDMEIHEHPISVVPRVRVGRLKVRGLHKEDLSLQRLLIKHFEYAAWEAARYAENNYTSRTFRQKVKYQMINVKLFPLFYFLLDYLLFLRLLDGVAGLKYSAMKFTYFSLVQEGIGVEKN
jgi:hypothetical protein